MIFKTKRLVINAEEQTVVNMFQWYGQGWGTHKIASQLNIQKISTKEGKQWVDTKVYKILSNPIYTGNRMWNNEPIEMPELRIIDDSLFANVKKRLADNANVAPINKHFKYDYLLAGKIRCACGQNYVGQGRHNIYMCKTKKYAGGCNTKSVKINWLDEEVKKHLIIKHSELLNDNASIINKTAELQDELLHLQEKVNEEKTHQNYLINNIIKIGQQIFDKKFDASTALVKQLQEQIDTINIKLSNTKNFMQMATAVARIIPTEDGRLIVTKAQIDETFISKDLVQKIVERIDIDNDQANVTLVNGNTFTIKR